MDWTMLQAKADLQRKLLKRATIEFMVDGFMVILTDVTDKTGLLVDSRDKQPRHFKTFESALSAAAQIGFSIKSARVYLEDF